MRQIVSFYGLSFLMQGSVSVVESRKFLPLLYQLAARMSKKALEDDPFQQVLQEVREWGLGREREGAGEKTANVEGRGRERSQMMSDTSIHTVSHCYSSPHCVCAPMQIILYTAKDHPHHSLYIILAMGNATKDDEYPLRGYVCGSRKGKSRRTGTGGGGGGGSHSVDEVRRSWLLGNNMQPGIVVCMG